jgi:sugar/nucleoside kinase (ribokinase family)
VPDSPVLAVLGELVVDLLPVTGADAGPEGTAPQYVARPGGNALDVAVAAAPDERLLDLVDDAALVAALNCTRLGADPPTRAELEAARSAR